MSRILKIITMRDRNDDYKPSKRDYIYFGILVVLLVLSALTF